MISTTSFFLLAFMTSQIEEPLADRFRTEAPSAWKDYATRIQKFEGPIKLLFDGAERQVFIKQRPECASIFLGEIVGGPTPDLRETCYVLNPNYTFVARRAVPERQWLIADLRKNDAKESLEARRAKIELFDEILLEPVTFMAIHYRWRNLAQEPGFALKSATTEMKHGRAHARIGFEFKPKARKSTNRRASGTILFDPDHCWVISEFDADVFVSDQQRSIDVRLRRWGSFEYATTRDGFPVPTTIVVNHQNVTKKQKASTTTWQYELKESESPEADFYTPAFDLPDAGTLRRTPSPWYLWLGLAGFACILLAIGFQRLRRHQAEIDRLRRFGKRSSLTPS